MEQEYSISTGMKIFYGVLAIGLFGFSIFLFSIKSPNVNPAVYLLPLAVMAGSVLIIINIIKKKVTVYDDRIICANLFSTRELAFNDIKGCRVGQKTIYIEPVSDTSSKIVINNYDDLVDSQELTKYLKEHFKDIDKAELEIERDRLLHDTSIGATEADREKRLRNTKQISWAYNIIGMAVALAMILFTNNKLTVILLLAYPLLGVLIMLSSKGLIKFLSNTKTSMYGFTMLGITLPGFVLLIKSLFQYALSVYDHLWIPALIVSVVIFIILYFVGINKSVESITAQIIIMFIAGLLYGFGSIIQINCAFDDSNPQLVHSKVDSKWIEHNKGAHYHLKINSWDTNPKPKDIEVSRSTFDQYSSGNSIEVNLKEGLLSIPWYYINE